MDEIMGPKQRTCLKLIKQLTPYKIQTHSQLAF